MQDVWISPGLFFRYICQPDNCLRYGKVLAQRWQTIPERGVVRSCEPFKFRWVPTVSLERLIVSGAVNLVRRWVSQTSDGRRTSVDHTRRRDLYSAARPSSRNGLITMTCDTEYLACAEPLRRAGLSAAAETLVEGMVYNVHPFNAGSVIKRDPGQFLHWRKSPLNMQETSTHKRLHYQLLPNVAALRLRSVA